MDAFSSTQVVISASLCACKCDDTGHLARAVGAMYARLDAEYSLEELG